MGKYDELHTCHNECERPACVLRRKVATLEAELAAMKARGDRLAEALGRIAKREPCHCMSCTHMGEMARQALTEWRDQ